MPERENMKSEKGIKTNLFNLILVAFSLIFLVVYLYCVDGVHDIAVVMSKAHLGWLFIALGCVFVYWFLEACVLHLAIKPVHPSQRFTVTLRLAMIGQYFNCVTPFASGGQPAQAYFLVKRGAPLGEAMTALLTKFIVYQLTMSVYFLTMLILRFSFFMNYPVVKDLMLAVLVGFVLHTVVTVMLIAVAFFKNGTIRTANILINILTKIRILKNPEAKRTFVNKELENFHDQFKFMSRHKMHLLKMGLLTAVQLTAYFLIGNMLFLSFRLGGANTLTLIASQAFVLMIAAFMPIPGAIGAAEGSFYVFFNLFFGSKTRLAVVLWRLITFYLPILIGLIVLMIEKKRSSNLPLEQTPVVDELSATGGEPIFDEKLF